MKRHTERDGQNKERISPEREYEKRSVFGKRVHGVEHLDKNEDGETHGGTLLCHPVSEHVAADFREVLVALMEMSLRQPC